MNDFIHTFMNAKGFRYRLVLGGTLFVAFTLMGGQAWAQVKEKRNFASDKDIASFENTTFCTAFLDEHGSLYTLRDIAIVDISDIDKIAFNPTGSSLALIRGDKNITIYSFRQRNQRLFELKDKTYKIFLVTCEIGSLFNMETNETKGTLFEIPNTEVVKNGKSLINMIKEDR